MPGPQQLVSAFRNQANYKKTTPLPINILPEIPAFTLLGLIFTGNLNWNEYMEDIAKAMAKKLSSLYSARKLLTPGSILSLQDHSSPCIEYCCHITLVAGAGIWKVFSYVVSICEACFLSKRDWVIGWANLIWKKKKIAKQAMKPPPYQRTV